MASFLGDNSDIPCTNPRPEANKTQDKDSEQTGRNGKLSIPHDDIPPSLLPILHTLTELAQGRKPSCRPETAEGDLTWYINPEDYDCLQALCRQEDEPDSGYRARQEYNPRSQLLRLRMPTPLHEDLASSMTGLILRKLHETLQNHSDPEVRNLCDVFRCGYGPSIRLNTGLHQSPDGYIKAKGEHIAFVLEVQFAEPLRNEKAFNYIYDSDAIIRTVLYLKVKYRNPGKRKEKRGEPYGLSLSLFDLRKEPSDPDCNQTTSATTFRPTLSLQNVPIPLTPDECDQNLTFRLVDFHRDLPQDTFTISQREIRELLDDAAEIQAYYDDTNSLPRGKGGSKLTERQSRDDEEEGEDLEEYAELENAELENASPAGSDLNPETPSAQRMYKDVGTNTPPSKCRSSARFMTESERGEQLGRITQERHRQGEWESGGQGENAKDSEAVDGDVFYEPEF